MFYFFLLKIFFTKTHRRRGVGFCYDEKKRHRYEKNTKTKPPAHKADFSARGVFFR